LLDTLVPDDIPQLDSAPLSPVPDVDILTPGAQPPEPLNPPPLPDGLPMLGAIPQPKNVIRGARRLTKKIAKPEVVNPPRFANEANIAHDYASPLLQRSF